MEKDPFIESPAEPDNVVESFPLITKEILENYKNKCVIINERGEVIASADHWEDISNEEKGKGTWAYIPGDEPHILAA